MLPLAGYFSQEQAEGENTHVRCLLQVILRVVLARCSSKDSVTSVKKVFDAHRTPRVARVIGD